MSLNSTQSSEFPKLSKQNNSAMFSLNESASHYLVAVDIPTIPTKSTQILTTKEGLVIEGFREGSESKQTVFRWQPQGKGVKATNENGVLWLLLPKLISEAV
ncbi:MAG: Hsp20/alpha crystallin family protein [Pseudomonadota bacterium]|nr:Hsp20/alpha crystallin family protein [Pseudomonadota bacterium]